MKQSFLLNIPIPPISGREYQRMKYMVILLITIFISFIYSAAYAQENAVTGTVYDEKGATLPGVTILVKGTSAGTVTDYEGKYTLQNVKKDAVLVLSFISYLTEEVAVNGRSQIDISLKPKISALDEVVVVGYGTQKKSDLTGAVSSINAETISQSGVISVDQALQGRVAGVQMTNNTGLPGGSTSIQIRGLSSINSTNEPIFVIDGVIINSGAGATDNPMAALNPNDIESIEVLKDASATAIYGAQGGNGVIIVTTKRGKQGAPRMTFDARYGVQHMPKYLEMTNLQEYATHLNALYTLRGWGLNDYFSDPSKLGMGTDWQREIFRPASMQTYNFSVSGGSDNTTYRMSGNYLNQDGVAVGSGFDRITIMTGIDTKLRSWAKLGGTMNLTRTEQVVTIADWNLINSAVRQSPSVPARNLDGSYGGPEDVNDQLSNPLALAELLDKGSERLGARGNLYLDINPVKWLSYKTEFAADFGQDLSHSFTPTYRLGNRFNSEISNVRSQRQSRNWSWRNIATLKNTFANKHNTSLMLGHEITERTHDFISGQRFGGSNQLTDLDAGDANTAMNGGNTGRSAFNSVFGRMFYSFNDKYMLTTTLRYDGSSNFAPGYRWGLFPSAAVAWRVSEEQFLKGSNTINNLKFRLGYGQVGNSNITQFAHTAILANVPTIWGTGHRVGNVPNPDVTWETTTSYNLGLDFGLWKNKIDLVADVYYKKTDDLLLALTLPGYTGTRGVGSASQPWGNIGSLENKGFELALNTVNIDKKDFQWRSSFVYTQNRNKILKLNTESAQIDKLWSIGGANYIVTRTVEGRSIGEFYGYRTIGRINSADDLYDADGNVKIALPEKQIIDERSGIWIGDLIWDDYNKDGVINEQDRQFLGSPLPKFTYGFGNTFTYKNFDLNIFFQGSYGNKVMNILNLTIENPNNTGNLTRRAGMNYAQLGYREPGGATNDPWNVYVAGGDPSMPRMTIDDVNTNNRLSSRHIEDGSYLRLQTVNLSYTIPQNFSTRIGLNSVKLYANMQNLYTFSKYSGYDPEVGMQRDQYSGYTPSALLNGIDPGRYPMPRNLTFGILVGL